jgi:mono/diheme cytochrome c family protein
MAGAAGLAASQDATLIDRGKEVYAEERCRLCHSIDGQGNSKGPLNGVGSRLPAEEIELWIVDPKVMTEKTNATRRPPMKAYPDLSEQDLDAIVAYMLSLTEG